MVDVLWAIALLLAGALAGELRAPRLMVATYACQGLLLAGLLFAHGLTVPALVAAVSRGLILPGLLWWYGSGKPEAGPALGLPVIGPVLLGAAAWLLAAHVGLWLPVAFTALAQIGAALLAAGSWTLLTQRDLFKLVLGICLVENGVHALVVSLAPQLPEMAELGIAVALILAVWLLLFTGRRLKEVGV